MYYNKTLGSGTARFKAEALSPGLVLIAFGNHGCTGPFRLPGSGPSVTIWAHTYQDYHWRLWQSGHKAFINGLN